MGSQLAVIQTGGPSELLISLLDIAVHSTGTTAHPCTSWEPHWTRVKLSPSSRGDLWCTWSNHFRREHGAITPEDAWLGGMVLLKKVTIAGARRDGRWVRGDVVLF